MDKVTIVLVTTKRLARDLMDRYLDGDPEIIEFRRGHIITREPLSDSRSHSHIEEAPGPSGSNGRQTMGVKRDVDHDREGLLKILADNFNDSELKTLVFTLNVDYQDIGGDTIMARARELILYFERNNAIPDLLVGIRKMRPNLEV